MWPSFPPEQYCAAARELLQGELEVRQQIASQVRGDAPIDGLSIEYAIRELGQVVKIRNPDRYAGWANVIDEKLDGESKRLVYGWLQDFLLDRPQRSVWIRAYYRAQRKRERERKRRLPR